MSRQLHPTTSQYVFKTDRIAPLSHAATVDVVGGLNVVNSSGTVVASISDTGALVTTGATSSEGVIVSPVTTAPGADVDNTVTVKKGLSRLIVTRKTLQLGYNIRELGIEGVNNLLEGEAGTGVTTGTDNTLIGFVTAPTIVTGSGNVVVGSGADGGTADISGCVAIGQNTIARGNYAVAIGSGAVSSSGVSIGYNAGNKLWDVGISNTFVGLGACPLAHIADQNTAVGTNVGANLWDGQRNAFFGANAGQTVTRGSDNVCIGYSSTAGALTVSSVTVGAGSTVSNDYAVAIGHDASATAIRGIAIGEASKGFGLRGVAIGTEAIVGIAANYGIAIGDLTEALGVNSVAIGKGADSQYANATAIGYSARAMADNDFAIGVSGFPQRVRESHTEHVYRVSPLASPGLILIEFSHFADHGVIRLNSGTGDLTTVFDTAEHIVAAANHSASAAQVGNTWKFMIVNEDHNVGIYHVLLQAGTGGTIYGDPIINAWAPSGLAKTVWLTITSTTALAESYDVYISA